MTNDIKILSCPQCGFPRIRDCGNGLYQCDDCGAHFDKDENVVLTNEEWFCSLPTEEKAKFLRQIYRDGRDDYVGEWYEQTEADFVEWLKKPHTKE